MNAVRLSAGISLCHLLFVPSVVLCVLLRKVGTQWRHEGKMEE